MSRPTRPTAPRRGTPGVLALLLGVAGACAPSAPDPVEEADAAFTFAVVGDLPYSARAERDFPWVVASLERHDPAFVIHVGDIKGGSAPCTDSLLANRRSALAAVDLPVVYLPGDNEWTDCHRRPRGAYDPLERLDELRSLFYTEAGTATAGGRPMAVEQQADDDAWAEFVEHQRWRREGVLFLTVHAVGSRNGLSPFPDRRATHDAEVERRVGAAVAWIGESFAQARELGAPGVVVALHANPWIAPADGSRSGFEELLATLAEEARAFGGPVLVVHGDTHTFRVDHPLVDASGDAVRNVTRLETWGDPVSGWVEVAVDPDGTEVFTVADRRVR